MQGRAGALLAADHGEMVLVPIEISHEHDARLVEAGRRLAVRRFGTADVLARTVVHSPSVPSLDDRAGEDARGPTTHLGATHFMRCVPTRQSSPF
jgi:hypothetical protein